MSAVLVSGLTLATAASASNQAGEVFIPGKPLQQQIERIEIELNDGETYSELKQADRSRVREALVRMRTAVEQHPDRDSMPGTGTNRCLQRSADREHGFDTGP